MYMHLIKQTNFKSLKSIDEIGPITKNNHNHYSSRTLIDYILSIKLHDNKPFPFFIFLFNLIFIVVFIEDSK